MLIYHNSLGQRMKRSVRKRDPTNKRKDVQNEEEEDKDFLEFPALTDDVSRDTNNFLLQGLVAVSVLSVYVFTISPTISGGTIIKYNKYIKNIILAVKLINLLGDSGQLLASICQSGIPRAPGILYLKRKKKK